MKLDAILKGLNYLSISGNLDIEIENIVFDSNEVKDNSLFVAITGFKVNGHKFIQEVINKGVKALIIEETIEINKDITIIKVMNSREALSIISRNFYNNPSAKLNIIGITGTNGKTSCTYFIKSILQEKEDEVGIIGTLGSIVGSELTKTNNTTPESLYNQKMFYEMNKKGINTCIMEVSSHSLVLDRVNCIDFNIGIFTNLSEEHLDFHGTMENYMGAKLKLFYMTRDYNIVNADDLYGQRIIRELKKIDTTLITYGIKYGDIKAQNIELSVKGISFNLITPLGKIDINMKTPGVFNVYNALAAASLAVVMGVNLELIKKGLENIKGVKGRFEVLPINKEFDIVIDFAHSPDGFSNVLHTVKEFAEGRIITLFGCGGDRDRSKRPKMGRIASKYSDICVLTSDNSRTENTDDIIEEILIGFDNTSCEYKKITDRREAIKYAIKTARSKDIVLLLGKGHETYQIINGKTYEFNEFKIVQELLNELDNNR
ncbi:UDP-N-acetylmuramoyl-L-alanyl-D-glutamate--2,6-diaminopimelate ligase [Clostridium sp. D2Q-14]|uniref:UDP-N-acetylmuramoyl-L-alanyl-D-glutamate--2, 6-diaminopimelate ligase n=1 Tax=Anaeromonas gelatinilytica TaxID=2683194 RepID=UPI00193C7993|nr:UDP-N-acetylmuramoyl-L-alanyl-D-glutamate--2,6-diaminopimelate ligase [Anaeromonas gelatinilytica]MBS4535415.1 UDP-N-acetylmuramoyl-L-alanyl-D-glutamate--2,6-diaminopimelate ligase [Anaeromonas gelatinilytica]